MSQCRMPMVIRSTSKHSFGKRWLIFSYALWLNNNNISSVSKTCNQQNMIIFKPLFRRLSSSTTRPYRRYVQSSIFIFLFLSCFLLIKELKGLVTDPVRRPAQLSRTGRRVRGRQEYCCDGSLQGRSEHFKGSPRNSAETELHMFFYFRAFCIA